MRKKLKIGVLISGRGSNLQSLIDATQNPNFPAKIVLVIANVPGVEGIERAKKARIPNKVIDHKDFQGRGPFEDEIHATLVEAGVELVCLAGFMRLLTDGLVNRWLGNMINIHPSLLPSFKGLHTHQRAIDSGVRFSGCTIHFVHPKMDDGPIIAQASVPIHQDDTPDTLAGRVLIEEHKIYPLAVRLIADQKVSIENGKVKIKEEVVQGAALITQDRNAQTL
jgi:phosphoribosylglycinamide formyltransferase-1